MSILTEAGPATVGQVAGPVTMPGVAFGFSTRAVIDATAEAVRGLIGYEPTTLGADADMVGQFRKGRGAVMENTRVTDRYTIKFSGGSIAFGVKYARPWDNDQAPWRDTERSRGAMRQRAVQDNWDADTDALPWSEGNRERIEERQESVWDEWDDAGDPLRGTIKVWSVRSRLRMMKALADIDHDSWSLPDLRLGMVTLTLPDDWQAVAPRGSDFKRMVDKFRKRWVREVGPWEVVWKEEFQLRGAPHIHQMMRLPDEDWRSPDLARYCWARWRIERSHRVSAPGLTFRQWLSATWAACVAADKWACHACGQGSEGQRCDCPRPDTEFARNALAGTNVDFGPRGTDPKRIAIYFLKHSSKTMDDKEYQHNVPPEWWEDGAGPGRFWGISGLARLEETVEVPKAIWQAAKRLGRHIAKANAARAALSRRAHAIDGVSEATRRATLNDLWSFGMKKMRVLTDSLGGGWILSNDAPALVYRLAVFLASRPPGAMAV